MKADLIKYKNELLDKSREYYDYASINLNEKERDYEMAMSVEFESIAKKLEEIIYPQLNQKQ